MRQNCILRLIVSKNKNKEKYIKKDIKIKIKLKRHKIYKKRYKRCS